MVHWSSMVMVVLWRVVKWACQSYGSGFGSYVRFSTLFTCFLGFDVPTSSFILLKMFLIILVSFWIMWIFFGDILEKIDCLLANYFNWKYQKKDITAELFYWNKYDQYFYAHWSMYHYYYYLDFPVQLQSGKNNFFLLNLHR